MKKLFVSLSVIGFFVFALSQSSPATLLVNDNEIAVCADDTTKCVKYSGDSKKCSHVCDPQKCKDVCIHKSMKHSCDPSNCKDKSQMKKCSHENMNKKDPKKK